MGIEWNLDTIIFVSFLFSNLAFGLYHGRKVRTIEDYALGGRNFSTAALVSTIIATWIGGDYLFITLAEVYNTGLHYTIGCLGMVVCLLLNAYVFIPKMSEFMGSLSVAESMGKLYGKNVRIISAISGTIASAGFIAVQFKVFGEVLKNFVGLSGNMPIFLAAFIVIIYSAFGGIRSVTFTDIVQFFTFGVLIPVLGFVIWNDFNNQPNFSLMNALNSPIFDYKQFLGFENPKFWSLILLFLLFSLPDINPTMFQRVSMGRNIPQVKKAFTISAFILMIILLGMAWIAFLLFSIDTTLDPNSLVQHIIGKYSHTGLKSFILIGIVAMCMSTADSNINASSVLLTHDFCHPLNIKLKNELVLSKIISISLGIISIFLALLEYDLLPLVFMTQSFYIPIIDVPLILAILGFRTTTKAVLIGMIAGLIGVIGWRIWFMDITGVDSILPGMVVNFIFLMASHYLLKQDGGWIKNEPTVIKNKSNPLISYIKNLSLLALCKQYGPKNELTYTGLGLFCLISTVGTMYSMSNITNTGDLLFFYETMLVLAISFLTYPIWPITIKKDIFIRILWYIAVFYLLIVCSTFFVLLSGFFQQQVIIFILNVVVVAIIIRWDAALIMIGSGVYLATELYKYHTGSNVTIAIEYNQFILYALLLIGTVIIVFLKPRQQNEEVSETIKNYLNHKNKKKQFEVIKLYQYRDEFIARLDKQCIAVFKAAHDQIKDMKEKLTKGDSDRNLQKITNELIDIVDKLNAGSEYLDNVVFQIKDQVKLSPSKVNIKNFLYEVIDEYKKISGYNNLQISIELKTELTEIYIDQALIKDTLFDCFYHAIVNSSIINISITLEDTKLEYDISEDNSKKIKRDALQISIIAKNSTLTTRELQKIMKPKFDTISEIRSAEIQRIITAHYGQIKLILSKDMQATYLIKLPAKLKEIRPKKMDLPDEQLNEMGITNTLIENKNREILQNIAIDLIKAGMTPVFVAKITKLSLEEIKRL